MIKTPKPRGALETSFGIKDRMFSSFTFTQPYMRHCQDRAEVIKHAQGLVAVIADGAGGTGGGADAADTVIMSTRAFVERTTDLLETAQWVELLARLDRQISNADGQTTAVVVALTESGIAGASVGDSVAWVVDPGQIDELTLHQIRKPLLGTGRAIPISFGRASMNGKLLLASDGLVNYAKRDRIADTLHKTDGNSVCSCLANLARLQSGGLQDDIGIIVCMRD